MNITKIVVFKLFLTFLLCSSSYVLKAQGDIVDKLKSTDVSDLSDSQINNYAKRALEQGYTLSDLETIARQRGISESQISEIKNRYREIQTGGRQTAGGGAVNTSNGSFNVALPPRNQLGRNPNSGGGAGNSGIFGYSLFRSQSLSFAPNLSIPTPQDYVLGPGDELVVDFWGAADLTTTLTISQ
ncbi:MAG: polysaccharide biosynthesis/export family protein, partial [Bacteroidota bacterium]